MSTLTQLKRELRDLDKQEREDMCVKNARLDLIAAQLHVNAKLKPRRETLRAQIAALKSAKPKRELPPKLADFLRRMENGDVDWGASLRVTWHSEDLRFAVISVAGSSFLSGQIRSYAKAQHWLVDLNGDTGNDGRKLSGNVHASPKVHGRLTPALLEAFKEQAHTLRATIP